MFAVAAFLLLYQILHLAEGAPTGSAWQPDFNNLTALRDVHAPAWVPQPRYRGTWGVLYSCTLTLGLCVYTAIHQNIPARDGGRRSFYLCKAQWVLIAIFAPEAVLYPAWRQWYIAREVTSTLNELAREAEFEANTAKTPDKKTTTEPEMKIVTQTQLSGAPTGTPEPPSKRSPLPAQESRNATNTADSYPTYNLATGFYIVMGGFVTKCHLTDGKVVPHIDGKQFHTLSPEDVKDMAREGHFLWVETSTLQDKSKANILAKGLVCFQVFWMLVDGVARKVSGYPLAILEVHVFVHVLCALTMYGLWFKKPMDIQDPTVLNQQETAKLRTVMGDYGRKLLKKASNLGSFSEEADTSTMYLTLGILVVLCAAYGGVHLSTWNFNFPTPIEQKLWRISCILTVAGSVCVPGFLVIAFEFGRFVEGTIFVILRRQAWGLETMHYAIMITIALIFSPLLLASRFYLVLESFISIRDVPSGVYMTVPWAQYIPHI
ncbi:hypothetical protein FN846DRAFT_967233 [Sphaerosporella brunnea]|uniref:Uncharacterized protein n=1 Tax=Sphaerosporella brunnea TaxID=1250544 RepID=A0A5J5EL57_9PEZI|nr:hypothetical protein FN846DRAFT_967233 [Sphaerosporella brunnea]